MIEEFIKELQQRIENGLPGIEAQRKMAPSIRRIKEHEEYEYVDVKKAAVLLLFQHVAESGVNIILIKRTENTGVHSGQISFPGGKMDTTDADTEATALRETEEEIGVDKKQVNIVGKLSNLYIPPSNFYVFPYLGYVKQKVEMHPSEKEVAKIIEVPLNKLFQADAKGIMTVERKNLRFSAPYYDYENLKIWGATAIILSELQILLKE